MKAKQLYIWALRFSPARGWHVSKERDATNQNQAAMWISVFREDEPNIDFVAAYNAPKVDLDNLSLKVQS